MIEGDRGDNRGHRLLEDVGRVEAAAEADLDQRRIRGMTGEKQKGDCGEDFEDGDRCAGVGLGRPSDGIGQRAVVDELAGGILATEPVALVPGHEMRRGVDVDRAAVAFQDCATEGGDGALAVGAGDVDHRRQSQLRVPEIGEQPPDPVQRKIEAFRMLQHQGVDLGRCERNGTHGAGRSW